MTWRQFAGIAEVKSTLHAVVAARQRARRETRRIEWASGWPLLRHLPRGRNSGNFVGKKRLRSGWRLLDISPSQKARVVKWQTRTFEGRMPQGVRVQVPPRALSISKGERRI